VDTQTHVFRRGVCPLCWRRRYVVEQLHIPVTLHNTRELVLAQLGHLDTAQVWTCSHETLLVKSPNPA